MALARPSEPWAMTATGAAQRRGYAAQSELQLRELLETFCRNRWPDARICHEMVMGEGRVRADVVAIDQAHIAAFEVKGSYDDTTRLLHQVGMYQLAVPEVWIVVPDDHADDARLIRHLLPSVGLLVATGMDRHIVRNIKTDFALDVEAEAVPRQPVPVMTLALLWRDELALVCEATGAHHVTKRSTRSAMIKALLDTCGLDELMPHCCAALRSRDALWRADQPIPFGRKADAENHD